jgi:hypothetical protein
MSLPEIETFIGRKIPVATFDRNALVVAAKPEPGQGRPRHAERAGGGPRRRAPAGGGRRPGPRRSRPS